MSKKNGASLIAKERQRQIDVKGCTAENDDVVGAEKLELAAWCYRDALEGATDIPKNWPFSADKWKPLDRKRNLERAGALYQAAADTAERAANYELRNHLRDQAASCAIRLDSII